MRLHASEILLPAGPCEEHDRVVAGNLPCASLADWPEPGAALRRPDNALEPSHVQVMLSSFRRRRTRHGLPPRALPRLQESGKSPSGFFGTRRPAATVARCPPSPPIPASCCLEGADDWRAHPSACSAIIRSAPCLLRFQSLRALECLPPAVMPDPAASDTSLPSIPSFYSSHSS